LDSLFFHKLYARRSRAGTRNRFFVQRLANWIHWNKAKQKNRKCEIAVSRFFSILIVMEKPAFAGFSMSPGNEPPDAAC
jgi:hypothetical protein